MRWLLFLSLIVLTILSCSDRNPVNSGDGTGTAVIQCMIEPAKAAVSAELKPTTKAEISFHDSKDKRIAYQSLTVSGKRISGSIKVPAGDGYRAELYCFDRDSNPTFGGMATDITIIAGQETTITILLQPEVPESTTASGPFDDIIPGTSYTISWEAVSRAKSYTIDEATISNFSNATSKTTAGTSESFTKNTAGTVYYRVRANNSAGSSGWSNTVTVTVVPILVTLTIGVNNDSWGVTNPSSGSYTHNKDTVVTITATPASGYRFVSWTGSVTDASNATTTVTVTGNMAVTANFEKIPPVQYTLTMMVNTAGWGTTSPAVGSVSYDKGTVLTITATPASGYRFVSWTGSVADASSATTTVTVSSNMTVTANFEKVTTPGTDITFVSIPGGTFQMGDVEGVGSSNEKPVHTVTLTRFEMSVYEITNAQYVKYLNEALASGDVTANSSSVKGAKGADSGQEYIYLAGTDSSYPDTRCWITYINNTFSVVSGKENYPLVWVTWYGSKAFALYYGLDLPTEAEWEYACRGGKQYKYGTSDGTIRTSTVNYWDTGIKHPVDVGSYPANPFGLYDMSGNVWEWCHDWYGSYASGSMTNPSGVQTGSSRVNRGGGWNYSDIYCRSACRLDLDPSNRYFVVGFRVVRRVVSPQNY